MLSRLVAKTAAALAFLGLVSCGGSDPGSSVTMFKTVTVTASATPNPFVSQVAPGNTCTNGKISGGSITTDDTPAGVTFTSQVYSGVTNPKPVSLNGYTVSFSPVDPTKSPAINDVISGFVGISLQPGLTSTPVNIPLTSLNIRRNLATATQLQTCASSLTYYATIRVSATEQDGANGTITTTVPVIFNNLP